MVALALAISPPAPVEGANEGAPAPLTEPVAVAMMRLAAAGPADRLLVLGPDDGRIVTAAASRSGVRTAIAATDPFSADLSSASVIALHVSAEAASRLRPVLLIQRPGTRIVSPDANLGDWTPDRTAVVDLPSGKASVHLWIVPANLNGDWCGQETATGAVLRISQRLQVVEGTFTKATKALRFDGKIEGNRVVAAAGRLALEQSGDVMRVTTAQGNYAAYRFASFARTCCGTCP